MATIRQQRVADLLFEELSIMISNELEDPGISYVDVTSVVISRDLRNAKAFVYHRDEEVSEKDVLAALKRATPYLRGQIAERCGLRMTPELLFFYDDTPQRAARIDELLSQISQNRPDEIGSEEDGRDENSPAENSSVENSSVENSLEENSPQENYPESVEENQGIQ